MCRGLGREATAEELFEVECILEVAIGAEGIWIKASFRAFRVNRVLMVIFEVKVVKTMRLWTVVRRKFGDVIHGLASVSRITEMDHFTDWSSRHACLIYSIEQGIRDTIQFLEIHIVDQKIVHINIANGESHI